MPVSSLISSAELAELQKNCGWRKSELESQLMASLTSARNRFHAEVRFRLSQVLSIPAERGLFSTQIVR